MIVLNSSEIEHRWQTSGKYQINEGMLPRNGPSLSLDSHRICVDAWSRIYKTSVLMKALSVSIGKNPSARFENRSGIGTAIKAAVGTKHLPDGASEMFRLQRSQVGSLSPCWVPALQIRCDPWILRVQEIQTFPSWQEENSPCQREILGLQGLTWGYSATFQVLKGE